MKLQRILDKHGDTYGYAFYCPGCHALQTIHTGPAGDTMTWKWNHDVEHPTFAPSLRTHWSGGKLMMCHASITDGAITFTADCSHELAGQTVELPELEEVI